RVRRRDVDRTRHRPAPQPARGGELDALVRDAEIGVHAVRARRAAAMQDRRARGRADADEGIDDEVAGPRHRQHAALDQLDRKLAGMHRLLDVVRLDVREDPDVAGVLAARVPRVFARARSLPGALSRVLLRHPDRIEGEYVVVALREPEDDLVATGETLRAVQAVLEVPDDAIPEPQRGVALEAGEEQQVERQRLVAADVIADLPA